MSNQRSVSLLAVKLKETFSYLAVTVARRDFRVLSRCQSEFLQSKRQLSDPLLRTLVSIPIARSRRYASHPHTSSNFPPTNSTIIPALKCDLRDDRAVKERLQRYGTHPVQYEEGLAVARRIRASRYLGPSPPQTISQLFNSSSYLRSHQNAVRNTTEE